MIEDKNIIRAVQQLRLAHRFIYENDLETYTLRYDGTDCDGAWMLDELKDAADALDPDNEVPER